MLQSADISAGLAQAGIGAGSALCVQASYKGTGGVDGGIEGLIAALQDHLGPEGTLLMPAYNFVSWTEGHYFDNRETASTVGAVPEVFRTLPGVRRTRHPIHSLSVWGRLQDPLCGLDYQNSFGPDSVFAALLEHNISYCTLGLGLEMPFLPCHFTETTLGAPYRRLKRFSGIYVDEAGAPSLRTYGFDVRRDAFRDTKAPIFHTHRLQFERGAFAKYEIKQCDFYAGSAQDYERSLRELMEENRALFGWEP